jgi:uncharacterized protein
VDDRALIRTVMDAANRNEMDFVAAHVHDDFLGSVPPSMSAEPDSYEGPEGVQRYFDLFRETVDDLRIWIHEFEGAGDWIIAVGEVTGTGRASGIPIKLGVALGTQIRDGKLYRMEAFPDVDQARLVLATR